MRAPISSLEGIRVDVLVIGAGINGASAAQHLRAAGYSVLLVDKGDFASGTTGRSTRLMHWGIRFLAPERSPSEYILRPGRFIAKLAKSRRVFDDYKRFRKDTPEYLNPLKLLLPLYGTHPVAGWQLDLGAWLLGAGRTDSPVNYRRHSGSTISSLPVTPLLRDPERLRDILEFEDCQFVWPERICVDAVLDTARMGGFVRNYTRVTEIERSGKGWSIEIADEGTGERARLHAHSIANMAGVWIDAINKAAAGSGNARPSRKVIAVKGVHIMVDLPERYRAHAVVGANTENEPIFCMPWRGLHYFGPTETVYHGAIDDVVPEEQDLDFLVEEANHLFPDLGLRRDDVRFAWAGLRSITYHPSYAKGDRAATSRIHDMTDEGLPNVFALTWGTINQHRAAARRMVKTIGRRLRPSQAPVELSYRARFPTPSAGSAPVISSRPDVSIAMLKEMAAHEGPRTLADLLFRRTDLAWGPYLDRSDVERIAEAVAPAMGWSNPQPHVEEFASYLQHFHRYRLP